MKKKIRLCGYARYKFQVLARHKVNITLAQVVNAVKRPDKILPAHRGRKIAQKGLNQEHLLRVIYEENKGQFTIVTFYPARRKRYGNKL